MKFSTITKIVVAVCVCVPIVWTSLMMFVSPGDTISLTIRDVAYEHPIVPFVMGVLVGHWFFPAGGRKQ